METAARNQVIYSGIQPSGTPTLGNYIGAIRNWKALEDQYDCIYGVVDMHSITVRQDAAQLRRRCTEMLAVLLAVGLNPDRSILYFQSQVHQHAELAWVLDCYTYLGELSRMTQFKDKSKKNEANLNAGLFTYPALMAADILLYQTNLVPIGGDQKQHVELCRDVATRFNNLYGDVFTIPEGYIPKVGARVMSLQEPTRKMSKSDTDDTYVSILDDPKTIEKKIKRAVTDSEPEIRFDPQTKPGVSNLMSILGALGGESMDAIADRFSGQGYGALKGAVAEIVVETLAPIRDAYGRLMGDKAYLAEVAARGAERAAGLAERTMRKVRRKVGFAEIKA